MLLEMLGWASAEWITLKTAAKTSLGVSDDVLHCILGVTAQLGIAALIRSSIDRPLPWLIVMGLELLNEASDLHMAGQAFQNNLPETYKDLIITMILPTLLIAAARLWPNLFTSKNLDVSAG